MSNTQPTPQDQQEPIVAQGADASRDDLSSLPVIDASSGAAPVAGASGRDRAERRSILDDVLPQADEPAAPASTGDEDEDAEAALAYQSLMRHRKERRRKKLVRGVIIGAIALVAAVFLFGRSLFAGGGGDDDMPVVQTDFVYRDDFRDSISATGSARPFSQVTVTPGIGGTVRTVDVQAGEEVTPGQTLMTVENDDLDIAISEAWFAYKDAEAAVNEAQTALNAVWYGDDQAAKDSAYIALERAKIARDKALDAYQKAVDDADGRTVKAPITGTVLSVGFQVGDTLGEAGIGQDASTGTGTIKIADVSQMRVTVQVSEMDITRVAVGQHATVTFSALPDVEMDAEVSGIAASSSGDDGGYYGGGYGSVNYAVELVIPNPDPQLKPGMTASVRIDVQSLENVLMVPSMALMTDDGETYYVMVVTDPETGEAEQRFVEVLAEGNTTAAVDGDLAEGDEVLIGGAWDMGFDDDMSYDGGVAVAVG